MITFSEMRQSSKIDPLARRITKLLEEQFQKRYSIPLPEDTADRLYEQCADVRFSQKTSNRLNLGVGRTTSYKVFIETIKNTKSNLRYTEPFSDWDKFYVFPTKKTAQLYAHEAGINEQSVCNRDKKSTLRLLSDLIALSRMETNSTKVKFLEGTTGVGKTTFLKFFCKQRKDRALKQNMILSRIKFINVQEAISDVMKIESADVNLLMEALEEEIFNCLVRDIIDSFIRSKNLKVFPDQTRFAKLEKILDEYKSIHLRKVDPSIEKWDDLILESRERTDGIQVFMDRKEKIDLIKAASGNQFSFCIILDGFDAMKPEEIQLFDDDEEAAFLKCVSRLLKGRFSKRETRDRCLSLFNKTYFIAARPITIAQLVQTIERETQEGRLYQAETAHVVGSDIYRVYNARLMSKLKGNKYSGLSKKLLCLFAEAGIRHAVKLLYAEHKHLTGGRFIELFNHNIREKIDFLTEVLDLLIYRVEEAFARDRKDGFFGEKEPMSLEIFQTYIKDEQNQIRLSVYEIQKLLILNENGYFKNYYGKNLRGEVVAETKIGQIDNVFRYYSQKPFNSDHDYLVGNDPILEKFLVMYRLSKSGPQTIDVLKAWFQGSFGLVDLRTHALKILIRNGFISVIHGGADLKMELSTKGKFVFRELLHTSVYLENAILSARVPFYVSRMMKLPDREDQNLGRAWGRCSVTNITVFLCYLKTVIMAAVNEDKIELKLDLISKLEDMQRNIHSSFELMITEGLHNESEYYFPKLRKELQSVGVTIM